MPSNETTENIAEWNYGDYEGLLISEIKQMNPTWNIWKDGCPGGESVEDVTKRIDDMIAKVREYHRLYKEEGKGKRDSMTDLTCFVTRLTRTIVVIVAHGHILRCFISRWVEFPLCLGQELSVAYERGLKSDVGTHFNVEPASIAMLTYQHNNREYQLRSPVDCG